VRGYAPRPSAGGPDSRAGEFRVPRARRATEVRAQVAEWLAGAWDPGLSLVEWRALLAGSGWGCPAWPREWCGRGLPAALAEVVAREFARVGAVPPPGGVGMQMAAPTILQHGSDGLKQRFIRATVTGEISWCQLARLDLNAVPGRLVGADGGAAEIIERTLPVAVAALAAEQVGGAQRCLDMSVDYAKMRMQFGRPIGSFQAIKHLCADMLLEVESARSAAYYAAWAAQEQSVELPLVASLAKAYCSEAYFHAAADNIQIHGGIGFTWEHDAHLYYRRVKSAELMLGTPGQHREIAASFLIDGRPIAAHPGTGRG
jgi:alkylation response protein AidB-like acyl-CoA dehydrogenase